MVSQFEGLASISFATPFTNCKCEARFTLAFVYMESRIKNNGEL
jgi:hypothetical protein